MRVFVCLHVCVCVCHIPMPSYPGQSRRGMAAFGVDSCGLWRELCNGALSPMPYDRPSALLMVSNKAINMQRNAPSLALVQRCAPPTTHARTTGSTDGEVLCLHISIWNWKDVPHEAPLPSVHGFTRHTKFQPLARGECIGGCHAQHSCVRAISAIFGDQGHNMGSLLAHLWALKNAQRIAILLVNNVVHLPRPQPLAPLLNEIC